MAAACMIGVIQWGRLEFLLFLVVAAALVIGVTAFWMDVRGLREAAANLIWSQGDSPSPSRPRPGMPEPLGNRRQFQN